MNNSLYFLAILPIIGVCIKWSMDAWSNTNKHSNMYAISSIVQYSLMTVYLAIAVTMIARFIHNNTGNVNIITSNLKLFFASLCLSLIVYVAIIVLYALYYPRFQYGYITPSISGSINKYIMIPLWILIFYNMYTLIDCNKPNATNACDQKISFLTLSIVAFGLMQVYLVVNSFKIVQLWPTDDTFFAP